MCRIDAQMLNESTANVSCKGQGPGSDQLKVFGYVLPGKASRVGGLNG